MHINTADSFIKKASRKANKQNNICWFCSVSIPTRVLAAPRLLLIHFSELGCWLLPCPCCARDESRCSRSHGVIWILRFRFDLAGFLEKIVSLLPRAVEEELKNLTWGSVTFFSVSVVSVFWLPTLIVLAGMLHLSNTLNPGWGLSHAQNPLKFLQRLFAGFSASLSATPVWTQDYCVQRFVSAVAACEQGVLLKTGSCIQRDFSSQMRCSLCPIWANKGRKSSPVQPLCILLL